PPRLHGAAREGDRSQGLHAVPAVSGRIRVPGPRRSRAHRDGIHGRIPAPIVTTHELDTGADGDRSDRSTARAATPATPATPATASPVAVAAAARERREREHPAAQCASTHSSLLSWS